MTVHLIHVPRTGGTSLRAALAQTNVMLHPHSMTMQRIPHRDYVITLVRDPVARFLSSFAWAYKLTERWRTPEAFARYLYDDAEAQRLLNEGILFQPLTSWFDRPFGKKLLWVGHTETLDSDYQKLRGIIRGCTDSIAHINSSDIRREHRNDLSSVAEENIRKWYAEDYLFLSYVQSLDTDTISMDKGLGHKVLAPSPSN